ncbi:MAG: hypothetical protein RLZZ269_313 [Actinomycetota bacterium]
MIAPAASLPTLVALGPASTSDQPEPSRTGNGFHTRFADDLVALRAAGITDLRLGVDWARLQPRSGMGADLSGDWVEFYSDVITAADRVGVKVWATLLERTTPQWFDDERGFVDPKTADRHWPRFVEAVAEALGDRLAGWFPIDDPIGFAARREPNDAVRHGELVHTMLTAWRNAWRVLAGGPPVATSLGIRMVRPVDETVPAAQAARREEHLRFTTFLRGLRDGTVVIPGRADTTLADLAGAVDIIGVKIRSDLATDTAIDDESLRRWQERATTLLHRVGEFGHDKPVVVSSFRASRSQRAENARDAEVLGEAFIRAVQGATNDGIDITHAFAEPAVAATKATQEAALLDWDRHPTPFGEAWRALSR